MRTDVCEVTAGSSSHGTPTSAGSVAAYSGRGAGAEQALPSAALTAATRPSGRLVFDPSPAQVRDIISTYNSGSVSIEALAAQWEVSARTMRRLLRREGVAVRGRGRPGKPLPPASELHAALIETGSVRGVIRRYRGISERRLRQALRDLSAQTPMAPAQVRAHAG